MEKTKKEPAVELSEVEKLALKLFPKNEKTSWGKSYSSDNELKRIGFIAGYNLAKSTTN